MFFEVLAFYNKMIFMQEVLIDASHYECSPYLSSNLFTSYLNQLVLLTEV